MTRRHILIVFFALCTHATFAMNEAEVDSIYRQFHIAEVEVTARALNKDIIVPQTLKGPELQRLNALRSLTSAEDEHARSQGVKRPCVSRFQTLHVQTLRQTGTDISQCTER